MPNMDGIQLIREIRKKTSTPLFRFFCSPLKSQASKKEEAKSAGATGWIVKPFVQEKLLKW